MSLRLAVNLARRPAENRRRVWILWGGALGLLSVALLALAVLALLGWHRTRAIKRQTAAVRARMTPLLAGDRGLERQLVDPDIRATLDQAAYFNQLLDRKSLSWTLLFERLESLMPDQVEMLSLKPMERKGGTAIDLVFASDSFDAANEFVGNLEASPDFAEAEVVHEAMIARHVAASGGRPEAPAAPEFEFEITVSYLPAAPASQDAPPSAPAPVSQP